MSLRSFSTSTESFIEYPYRSICHFDRFGSYKRRFTIDVSGESSDRYVLSINVINIVVHNFRSFLRYNYSDIFRSCR